MSPFLVYLMFQMDSIAGLFFVLTVMAFSASAIYLAIGHLFADVVVKTRDEESALRKVINARVGRLVWLGVTLACVTAFLPSTKLSPR